MNIKTVFSSSLALVLLLGSGLSTSMAATSTDISIETSINNDIETSVEECPPGTNCQDDKANVLSPTLTTEDAQKVAKQEIETNTLKATEEKTTETQSEEELKLIDERLREMEKRHLENVDKLISQFDDKFSTDLDPLSLDNPLDQNTMLKEKREPKKPEFFNNFKGSGIYIGGYPLEAILAILLPPLLYSLWHLARKALGKT